jgi:hypothetical protein
MGPIEGSETSVSNCHYTLRKVPEERRSHERVCHCVTCFSRFQQPLWFKIYDLIYVTFGISKYIATNDNINSQQDRQCKYNVGF